METSGELVSEMGVFAQSVVINNKQVIGSIFETQMTLRSRL